MNRRGIDHAIDSLTRAELRAYAAHLTEWIGADAASRLVQGGPFAPYAAPPQLALGAVDADGFTSRLAHICAVALGAIRAESLGEPSISTPFSEAAFIEGIRRNLERAMDECIAGAQFDLHVGLDLTEALYRTVERIRAAAQRFDATWRPPSVDVRAHIARLGRCVQGSALDESAVAQLIDVCNIASQLDDGANAWEILRSAVAGERGETVARWIARHLERGPRSEDVVPLLLALEAHGDFELLVQAADLHLDVGPVVFEVLVRASEAAERHAESIYWSEEGRSRFPGAL